MAGLAVAFSGQRSGFYRGLLARRRLCREGLGCPSRVHLAFWWETLVTTRTCRVSHLVSTSVASTEQPGV